MEEYNIMIIREYKNLKCFLYNHLLIFIINTILNILLFTKMHFIYKVYTAFYLICTIIYFIFILIPIYPLILFKKRAFPKKAQLLKKLSFIIIFIFLFFSLLLNLIIFFNIYGLFSFYKECPYNFSYNDIANTFNINYNEAQNKNIDYKYSNKCSDNRCIIIEQNFENTNYYGYLCNYDSSYDFQSFNNKISKKFFSKINTNNNEIFCEIINETIFDNEEIFQDITDENIFIIKSYYNICSNKQSFYKCNRYEKPKEYKIKSDFSCPKMYNNIISIIIWIIAFIFNLILSLMIILVEFIKYKKIVKLYNNNIHINRESASTNGTTKSASKINGNNNQETINQSQMHSQTIIVEGHIRKKEEDININNRKINNIINNEVILPENNKIIIESEQILNLNRRINNDDIHQNLDLNDVDNSDRKKMNINFMDINNDVIAKNETADNYYSVNNSIEFKQNICIEPNDDYTTKKNIYLVK